MAEALAAYPQLDPQVGGLLAGPGGWVAMPVERAMRLVDAAAAPPAERSLSSSLRWPPLPPLQVFINNVNATLHELLAAADGALRDFHVLVPQDKLKLLADRVEVRAGRRAAARALQERCN